MEGFYFFEAWMTLGARLRKLRNERRWSIRELSRRTGVRRDIISGLEKGQKSSTQLSFLQRLAAALGVSVSALLEPGED